MTAMEQPGSLDEILEAALLAAGEPLSLERLEALFDDHERPPRRALREALTRVEVRHDRGAMELLETASGFQLRIRPRLSAWVSRLWDERPQRYSRALLETLALIAYRQPVTRGDIEEVRGVAVSSSIMRTLAERGWVRVVGHRDVPGRPAVYATTRAFLDDFGLKTLDELPPMHELKDLDESPFGEPFAQEAPPAAPAEVLAQADAPGPDDAADAASGAIADAARAGGEREHHPTTAGMADETHAGTASDRPGLSFADLEARLAERARTSVAEDGGAGAESIPEERSDDP
ncbi:SMC-Scp complex subunit ScpB [Halomonas campisalis]|uniref:SMC-Scp complex subunit ScpB n=1 Tax=Billgrantia campisalis TaxID=74661 RepID=A0ABS9P763_9GAMM|nr:SMC-Scp complex subunit ScpB [Halomonas campisalis]MCG6657608.1 SMC-Scp complex subunit ScpB [Halomonas campisalis]MDR5862620.1 SMC-Scp complex subunit ScpB [Halomonas campisalis]